MAEPSRGRGRWPAPVRQWINVADRGDLVALAKELGPRFGERVRDLSVHNGGSGARRTALSDGGTDRPGDRRSPDRPGVTPEG
ncbi:hypothetical protein ACIQU4_35885 [Streptomyces sp. NPDC090741]|uniref:hypothetical protein n=1 Tax=Streptomyces sp. NPDC090741 TaxID=3365967 RepID=UPI00380100AA